MQPMQPKMNPYSYELPSELIAQEPAVRRGDSRLMRITRDEGPVGEVSFRELPELLRTGDLLVLNDSRVLPARLWTQRPTSGGKVELLLVRPDKGESWLALARPARRLRSGQQLVICDLRCGAATGPGLDIIATAKDGYVRVVCPGQDLGSVAEAWGDMPLPPYIRRQTGPRADSRHRQQDRVRYQTVYACRHGSVAAPTAGLHFESSVLDTLCERGIGTAWITLHVGPGTFRPPSMEQVRSGRLHAERFHYPAATDSAVRRTRARGGRVIAVGTTSLRVLETVQRLELAATTTERESWPAAAKESAPLFAGEARRQGEAWEVGGVTRLFIKPPDRITGADGLLTNFHLPGSSLLMLVAAFAGDCVWRRAYARAVSERFRFYSYGDAMLILPPADQMSRQRKGHV